jgi:hypothetical protein
MAQRYHFTPNQVDAMEVVQVAILLGADLVSDIDWRPTEADLERMKGYEPAPGEDVTQSALRQLGIVPRN